MFVERKKANEMAAVPHFAAARVPRSSNPMFCSETGNRYLAVAVSSQTQSEPNLASAFPSTGEMTLLMEPRLSAFTVMIRFITSSDVMCSDLWGKEARNNSAILRAWDGLSQFRTMIVKILEVVEFIDVLESVDGMCAARESSVNQKRFIAPLVIGRISKATRYSAPI
jgi:hypothetical protein